MITNQIKLLDYNKNESFFPLPVGEFRWHFKRFSDSSVYITRNACYLLTNIKSLKTPFYGVFCCWKIKEELKMQFQQLITNRPALAGSIKWANLIIKLIIRKN